MHILAKQYIDSKEVCSNYFFRGLNELYILVPESHVFSQSVIYIQNPSIDNKD